jgi:death-on-curing protein
VTPEFLTLEDVLEIHALQLERYGGAAGLRDQGLLESALAQPEATFDGELLHGDLFAMAGAYLYHVVCNHPFVDGNKRTGLLAALVFLDTNGITLDHSSEELYSLTMAVAEGSTTKEEVVERLHQLAASR